MDSVTTIAERCGVRRNALYKKFSRTNVVHRIPLKQLLNELILVLDGTAIADGRILLIVYELLSNQPLVWAFVRRECFATWFRILSGVKQKYHVAAIVSDGQKGLIKAARELFPGVPHQRCIAHIVRRALAWLTLRPRTEAGRALRQHVLRLKHVRSAAAATTWENYFICWEATYHEFLKEKSINVLNGKTWFTHRRLRSIKSLIHNALSSLFLYVIDPRIPTTTNDVEGGLNALLSELLRRHRGITVKQKEKLATIFLYAKRKTKKTKLSTRKDT